MIRHGLRGSSSFQFLQQRAAVEKGGLIMRIFIIIFGFRDFSFDRLRLKRRGVGIFKIRLGLSG